MFSRRVDVLSATSARLPTLRVQRVDER